MEKFHGRNYVACNSENPDGTLQENPKRKAAPLELQCSCGWITNRHFNYHRHVLKHCSQDDNFHCDYCNKNINAGSTKTSYGIQFRKCLDCGQNFYNLNEYSGHVQAGCSKQPSGKLLCLVCQKTYKWVDHLKDHIQTTHLEGGDSASDYGTVVALMGRSDWESSKSNSKKLILCDVCDWSGDIHYNFHRHNFIHTGYTTYMCMHCHKQISPEKFNIRTDAGPKKIYKSPEKEVKAAKKVTSNLVCEQCGFNTRRIDVFNKHQVEHIPEEDRAVYTCNHCAYETFYQSSLRTHIAAKHDKKKSILELTADMVLCCELCGTFMTESREELVLHKQHQCPFRHKDLAALKNIGNQADTSISEGIELDTKASQQKEHLNVSDITAHNESLSSDFKSNTSCASATHTQSVTEAANPQNLGHTSVVNDNDSQLEKVVMDCVYLDDGSTTRVISSDLLNIKVPNPMQIGRTRSHELMGKTMKQKVYICDYCEFMCQRRWNMIRHKECLHKRKEVVCHICGYKTKYLPWLYTHYRRTHGTEPPSDIKEWVEEYKKGKVKFVDKAKPQVKPVYKDHPREEQNVIFRSRWSLYREKTAIPAQREVCHLCGKSLIKYLLKNHIKTVHSSSLVTTMLPCPYKVCTFSSARATNLSRHVKRVHMGIGKGKDRPIYRCLHCYGSFTSKRMYEQHQKESHSKQGSIIEPDLYHPNKVTYQKAVNEPELLHQHRLTDNQSLYYIVDNQQITIQNSVNEQALHNSQESTSNKSQGYVGDNQQISNGNSVNEQAISHQQESTNNNSLGYVVDNGQIGSRMISSSSSASSSSQMPTQNVPHQFIIHPGDPYLLSDVSIGANNEVSAQVKNIPHIVIQQSNSHSQDAVIATHQQQQQQQNSLLEQQQESYAQLYSAILQNSGGQMTGDPNHQLLYFRPNDGGNLSQQQLQDHDPGNVNNSNNCNTFLGNAFQQSQGQDPGICNKSNDNEIVNSTFEQDQDQDFRTKIQANDHGNLLQHDEDPGNCNNSNNNQFVGEIFKQHQEQETRNNCKSTIMRRAFRQAQDQDSGNTSNLEFDQDLDSMNSNNNTVAGNLFQFGQYQDAGNSNKKTAPGNLFQFGENEHPGNSNKKTVAGNIFQFGQNQDSGNSNTCIDHITVNTGNSNTCNDHITVNNNTSVCVRKEKPSFIDKKGRKRMLLHNSIVDIDANSTNADETTRKQVFDGNSGIGLETIVSSSGENIPLGCPYKVATEFFRLNDKKDENLTDKKTSKGNACKSSQSGNIILSNWENCVTEDDENNTQRVEKLCTATGKNINFSNATDDVGKGEQMSPKYHLTKTDSEKNLSENDSDNILTENVSDRNFENITIQNTEKESVSEPEKVFVPNTELVTDNVNRRNVLDIGIREKWIAENKRENLFGSNQNQVDVPGNGVATVDHTEIVYKYDNNTLN